MSVIDEKGLPSNLDAERSVLGSILLDDSRFIQIASTLEPSDFSQEKHRRIFRRMAELNERAERIDRVTLANELLRYNELESCDGLSYLVSLDDGLPQISNIDSYARIVKEKARRRRAILAADHLTNSLLADDQASTDELLSTADGIFREIGMGGPARRDMRSGAEIIEACGGMDKFFAPPTDGIPTPWPTVNKFTRGLQRSNLILLGGRPSAGKTTAALNIVLRAVRRGIGTLLFSLETPDRNLLQKLACISAEIRLADFSAGFIKSDERRKIMEAIEPLTTRLWISGRPVATARSIHSEVRRAQSEHDVGLVVIDYVQLMEGRAHQNRYIEVGTVSRELKLAALALDLPFLVLSQVGRDAEGRRPTLKDLRESGNLEQDADVVLFISPKLDKPGYSEIGVAKQRDGAAGDDCWIEVRFRKEHGHIVEETNEQGDGNSAFVNGLRASLR
jgi:replicative DNA helicase